MLAGLKPALIRGWFVLAITIVFEAALGAPYASPVSWVMPLAPSMYEVASLVCAAVERSR